MASRATTTESWLGEITVGQAMHPGVLTCPPDTPLREVARMMARYRIHAVVVFNDDGEDGEIPGVWGVVSDADLVATAAIGDVDGRTAGGAARTPVVTVRREESLMRAAELMREHRVTHLVVVSSSMDQPLGILSTLDLARSVALEPGHGG